MESGLERCAESTWRIDLNRDPSSHVVARESCHERHQERDRAAGQLAPEKRRSRDRLAENGAHQKFQIELAQ